MASQISPLLSRYKLNTSFIGTTVTHITQKSDLETKQRRVKVTTVWKTEHKLGAGAFGDVWRQRTSSGQLRAVKIISRDRLNIQEVEALIDLQDHPDLFILFFGWFEDLARDTIHLAMEYIEHGDLGKYITSNKTTVDAKEITSQILEGLVVLHERAICHRDLKPQNILVASLAPIWVKITDFGISKRWVGTTLKTHCGTAVYRSPEQLGLLPHHYRTRGGAYSNNIDMWALGAIVHEMLTADIPFRDTYVNEDPELTLVSDAGEEQLVDTGLLYAYCQGVKPFPCESLTAAGVAEDGVGFVKSLMMVDPRARVSAAAALANPWLVRDPPGPGGQHGMRQVDPRPQQNLIPSPPKPVERHHDPGPQILKPDYEMRGPSGNLDIDRGEERPTEESGGQSRLIQAYDTTKERQHPPNTMEVSANSSPLIVRLTALPDVDGYHDPYLPLPPDNQESIQDQGQYHSKSSTATRSRSFYNRSLLEPPAPGDTKNQTGWRQWVDGVKRTFRGGERYDDIAWSDDGGEE